MTISVATEKVRVPQRLLFWMDGTGWGQGESWDGTPEGDALVQAVTAALHAGRRRSDGSRIIEATSEMIAFLVDQACNQESASRDDAGWDADARGDLNSARAFVRKWQR